MGQPINVVEKPSSTPGIARFETNRSLTGMGHERYLSAEDVIDDRPVDELARRLFETGGVTQVHANGSMVTVHLADGWTGGRLLDVIRGLYVFYPPAAPTETEAETVPEAETAGEAQDTPDTVTEPHEADEATGEQEPAPQPEVVPEPESSISAGVDPAAEPDLEPAPDQDPEAVADAEVEAAGLEANGPEAAQPEPAPNSGTERAPAGTKSPK